MNREQIEKWARKAADHAHKTVGSCLANWHQIRDEHFARLVRNAALDEAVNECFAVDNTGDYACHSREECAHLIDALKEPQP